MARKTRGSPPSAYQLKVTLMETEPPIWRRPRVPGDTTLARLDSYLHTFTAGGAVYAAPDPEWDIEVRDERRARLGERACPPEDCGGVTVAPMPKGETNWPLVPAPSLRLGSNAIISLA